MSREHGNIDDRPEKRWGTPKPLTITELLGLRAENPDAVIVVTPQGVYEAQAAERT